MVSNIADVALLTSLLEYLIVFFNLFLNLQILRTLEVVNVYGLGRALWVAFV